jgi:hypothetical protein
MANDNEVGYGKPPKENRFKPGQSGNPRGRPRKQIFPLAIINAPLPMKVDGKSMMVSGYEASLRKTAHSAHGGNLRAIKRFISECAKAGLLKDAEYTGFGGVLRVPADRLQAGEPLTDAELKKYSAKSADRYRANNLGLAKSERDAAIERVAYERHYVPNKGQKMSMLEIIILKLKWMAFKEDNEPALAYFHQLTAQALVDVGDGTGGYIIVPEPYTEENTPMQIIDET